MDHLIYALGASAILAAFFIGHHFDKLAKQLARQHEEQLEATRALRHSVEDVQAEISRAFPSAERIDGQRMPAILALGQEIQQCRFQLGQLVKAATRVEQSPAV